MELQHITGYRALRLIVVGLIILNITCSVNAQTSNKICYKQLNDFVKDKWNYNKAENYYEEGKGLIDLTGSYYQCVKTMSRKQIIKIFGKPSKLNPEGNLLIYYEMPQCNQNCENCTKLYFEFQNNKIRKFGFAVAVSKSH